VFAFFALERGTFSFAVAIRNAEMNVGEQRRI
jgi:hypothetical protein